MYVQGQYRLPVPFEELAAFAERTGALRIAVKEHLLLLKAEAARLRTGGKRAKDRRDVARLLILLSDARPDLVAHLMTEEIWAEIHSIDHQTMLELTGGNSHEASRLLREVRHHRTLLRQPPTQSISSPRPPSPPPSQTGPSGGSR